MSTVGELTDANTQLHLAIVADSPTGCVPTVENTANLRRLSIDLAFFTGADCFGAMQSIKAIILHSVQLRELRLKVFQVSSLGHGQVYGGLGFSHDDRIPALTSLELIGYPFGQHRSENEGGFLTQGYSLEGREIDLWARNFDWSCLEKIITDDPRLANAILPKLTSLQEATFLTTTGREAIAAFYLHAPSSLQTIQVHSLALAPLEGIIRHGNTLRQLCIHQNDIYNAEWSQQAVDLPSLQQLRDGCPNLRILSLDLARSGDWPYEAFDILMSFPMLTELDIWFELGACHPESPVEPFLTRTGAEHIFHYFTRDGGQASDTLCALKLHCGAYPRRDGADNAFIAPEACWPQYNMSAFKCERQDSQGAPGEGDISITNVLLPSDHPLNQHGQPKVESSNESSNPNLRSMRAWTKAHNLLSRLTRKGHSKASSPVDDWPAANVKETIEVAEYGPRPLSQWKAHY